ncbi:hypothetical protein R1flu_006137 [Riccia fluitans]|uniref:Uncharacterized protein n=1 Tax=Riccia fluitans TaxID=41844 RepID=A0ABD1YVX0_9MARC
MNMVWTIARLARNCGRKATAARPGRVAVWPGRKLQPEGHILRGPIRGYGLKAAPRAAQLKAVVWRS